MNKILAFVVKEDKFLLLKGSDNDPQYKESFWYVVTGAVEECDYTLQDAVIREVKEECAIEVKEVCPLNWTFLYESLGNKCVEKAFVAYTTDEEIIINEESVDYKWCGVEEFIQTIRWFGDKEKLRCVLESILIDKIPFENEEIEKIN